MADSQRHTAEPEQEEGYNPEDLIGQTIAERYEIIKRIGRGGMGVVYVAKQSTLSRYVVIKLLAPELLDDQSALARFEREARGLSRLMHPNVVTIFDFGRDGDHAYIAMEYVQGETLSRYLRRTGPLQMPAFAPIAIQILKGLAEAHKLGLIHRDLKPANIMLCDMEGEPNFVKILDFGLAKLVKGPAEVTKEQHLVGSAAFLSPEQILHSTATPASDVYALGVLFYLMLSGKRPFRAQKDVVLLYKHVNEDPPPLATVLRPDHDIPNAMIDLIMRCLAKAPEARPADANAFLAGINEAIAEPLRRLPWATTQIQALSPAASEPQTPLTPGTGPIDPRDLQEFTPSSLALDETRSQLNIPGSMSGQSVIMMAAPSSKRTFLFGAVLALLVVAVAGLVAAVFFTSPPASPIMERSRHTQTPEQLTEVLDEVEDLLAAERWGKAELLLESVPKDALGNSTFLVRMADLRDLMVTGRLLAAGTREHAKGDLDGAIASFQQVLERDPSNAQAQKALAEATATRSGMEHAYGVLSIAADHNATVFIDGRESGAAPITIELPPGEYAL